MDVLRRVSTSEDNEGHAPAMYYMGCRPTYTRRKITISKVVLGRCKGDKRSQWEAPIFGPLIKFVTSDYVVGPTTHANLGFQGSNWSVSP